MAGYNSLVFSNEKGIATIELNRPEVYNAFNDEMSYELQAALKEVSRDDAARVLVLTGVGKAFCSGQDLKEAQSQPDRSFSDSLKKRYNPIIRAIRNLPKPVICKVNGVAAGAGCSVVLACDYILAARSASLIEVFINIGLVPDSGSSFFLPNLVGYHKAFELCSLGSRVSAEEAFALGIVNKVVDDKELDESCRLLATQYASAPTKSIGMIKKMLNKAQSNSLEQALEYETYCQDIAGRSMDYKEGVNAFLEKRKPDFKGE